MKLIVCDVCRDVLALHNGWQQCSCGMIGGKYVDGRVAKIEVEDRGQARVLGVPNALIDGDEREVTAWVFRWNDPVLQVWERGTLLFDSPERRRIHARSAEMPSPEYLE